MKKVHFTLQEVFRFGYHKTAQHFWFVFLTCIISSTIISATASVPFLFLVVSMMAAVSLACMSLLIARDHSFSFNNLFSPLLSYRRVLNFFILASLYLVPTFLVALSLMLLVVGVAKNNASAIIFGFIVSVCSLLVSVFTCVRFKFFPYVVVENEHMSIKSLIRTSYNLTENNFWSLFGFILVSGIINFIGALLFGVGLLVTIPITLFAFAHLYEKFKNHKG